MNLQKEREIAEKAALEAGERIRNFYNQGNAWVKEKSPNNPLTQADHEANEIIHKHVTEAFPSDAWRSEESENNPEDLKHGRLWIVDPLDGTLEFCKQVPEFAVSIALCIEGNASMGVIYNPITEELFSGAVGEGVYLNSVKRDASAGDQNQKAKLLVSNSEFNKGRLEFIKDEVDLVPKGGTAYKLALVAAGLTDAYISVQPKNNWDFAAGVALVKASGRQAAQLKGESLEPLPAMVQGLCVADPAHFSSLVGFLQAEFA